jgi:hypothetical protein
MKTLQEILDTHKLNIFDDVNMKINPNYGTDKGYPKSYITEFYENFLLSYKNKNNTVVEIGVRSGASLKLWSEYFNKGTKIYGLDNLHDKDVHYVPVNPEWVEGDNVEYIIGDAYSKEIANKFESITILIDDGPHCPDSHVKLTELYADKMQVGGAMIIEDVGYDPNGLLPLISEDMRGRFSYYDFGKYYDNKIILFQF